MDTKIIVTPTLKEQVYEHLKKAIINGELQFGNFYSVQWVASQLGISRSPVREAVQQLQHEGLVDVYPYKGFTIKTISPSVIEEVFEVREAIESFCIKKVLNEYGSPQFEELIAELREKIEEQKNASTTAKEPMDYWKLDKGFHRLIIDFCNNKTLKQVYESISDKISSIALATLQDRKRFGTASEEHEAILRELEKGSLEAISVNLVHLTSTKELVLNTLENKMNGKKLLNN